MGLYNRVVIKGNKPPSPSPRPDTSAQPSLGSVQEQEGAAAVHPDSQLNDEEKKKPSTVF